MTNNKEIGNPLTNVMERLKAGAEKKASLVVAGTLISAEIARAVASPTVAEAKSNIQPDGQDPHKTTLIVPKANETVSPLLNSIVSDIHASEVATGNTVQFNWPSQIPAEQSGATMHTDDAPTDGNTEVRVDSPEAGGGDTVVYSGYGPKPPESDKILNEGVYLTNVPSSLDLKKAIDDYKKDTFGADYSVPGSKANQTMIRVYGNDLDKVIAFTTSQGTVYVAGGERQLFVINVNKDVGLGPVTEAISMGQLMDKNGPHLQYGIEADQDHHFGESAKKALRKTPIDGLFAPGVASLGQIGEAGLVDANNAKQNNDYQGILWQVNANGNFTTNESAGNLIQKFGLKEGSTDQLTGYRTLEKFEKYATEQGINLREQLSPVFGVLFSPDGINTHEILIQFNAAGGLVYLPYLPEKDQVQSLTVGRLWVTELKTASNIEKNPEVKPTPTVTVPEATPIPKDNAGDVLNELQYKTAIDHDYSIEENVTVKGQIYSKALVNKSGRIDGVFMDGEWKRGIPIKVGNQTLFIDGITDEETMRYISQNVQGLADVNVLTYAIQLSNSSRPSTDAEPTITVEQAVNQIKANNYQIKVNLPTVNPNGTFSLKETNINLQRIHYVFLDSRNSLDLDTLIPANAKFGGQDASLRYAIFADQKGEVYYVKISPRDTNEARVYSIPSSAAYVLTDIPSHLHDGFVDNPAKRLFTDLGSGVNYNLDPKVFKPGGAESYIIQPEKIVK